MNAILAVILALWLVKGLIDLSKGAAYMIAAVLSGIAGLALLVLAALVWPFEKLWEIATGE